MITIFVFQIFWKFGGFIVKVLAFRQFGADDQKYILDAYTFAESTIIWTLYVLFDKFIFPTFLPLFSEERELRGEDEAWKFANTFVNLLVLALLGTVTACVWWAPQVVNFIAPNWVVEHPDTAETAISFCRWMLPALFFVSLGSFTHALLNSYKRFAHAAAGAGFHRFAHAVVFFVAFWIFGAPAIWAAVAFFIASPAKPLIHLVGLKDKLSRYQFRIPYWRQTVLPALQWTLEMGVVVLLVLLVVPLWWPWTISGDGGPVKLALLTGLLFFCVRGLFAWLKMRGVSERTLMQKLYLLGYPVLMGVIIARVRDLVQDSYATHLQQDGLFGAIKIAKSVGEMPMAVIPLALSMAMFPFLCDMFTKQNLTALSEVVSHTLKMIVLFFVPLTVITIILRQPVIELLASNKVDVGLVGATALALGLYAVSFIFYASEMVLMQTYFSLQNTWLPTLIGAIASFAQVAFLFVAFDLLDNPDSAAGTWLAGVGVTPFIAVALAYPLSRAFKNVILGGVLHFELKLFHLRDLVSFVPQVVLVTIATGAATFGAWTAVSGMELTLIGKAVRLGVPSLVALTVFVGALFALKRIGWPVAEFDLIVKWLHESGWKKIRAKLGKK
jgi:peptidoglycan biosynthesis protein MviN/MurJ (putative lipid II flippase)